MSTVHVSRTLLAVPTGEWYNMHSPSSSPCCFLSGGEKGGGQNFGNLDYSSTKILGQRNCRCGGRVGQFHHRPPPYLYFTCTTSIVLVHTVPAIGYALANIPLDIYNMPHQQGPQDPRQICSGTFRIHVHLCNFALWIFFHFLAIHWITTPFELYFKTSLALPKIMIRKVHFTSTIFGDRHWE